MTDILISELNTDFKVRKISADFVSYLSGKVSEGYMPHYPVLIDQDNIVIDGHHRIEACKTAGISNIPFIRIEIEESERVLYAIKGNEASDTSKPMTFIDYAELIWSMPGTQADIAEAIGWKLQKVKEYSRLQKVEQEAWAMIVETFSSSTAEVENATLFSEGILRPIISLTPDQQIDLVQGLISNRYSKQAFKKQAENCQQQNKDSKFAEEQLKGIVTDEIYKSVLDEIITGKYNLTLLIQNAIDRHNKETSIRVINADCITELKKFDDNSVDLIATDPPYNMDKADWDSFGSGEDFALWCEQWMTECNRILTPEGSMYIFGINRMLSHIQRWLDNNMVYRNWIVWDTIQGAGGGLWTNRHESILYYSKTDDTYEDKEAVKLERHEENIREYKGKEYRFKNPSNIWRFPAVDGGSNERTDHITQKPVDIMSRIIKASCPMGGLVCDPFSGSGTTAVSAYRNGRKFVGIEMDKSICDKSLKRINAEIQ